MRLATFLRARYVFPVDRPPIADGVVLIDGERIVDVGPYKPGRQVRDLGNVALLPGLVNTHTHLEFSDLALPLGEPGRPLYEWIPLVVAERSARAKLASPSQSVTNGLSECATTGTTTVGEIAVPGWPVDQITSLPLDVTVFLELLGLSVERIDPLRGLARAHLAARPETDRNWYAALSPHAPYTVHPLLLDKLSDLRCVVAMHVAESPEEIELLRGGTGPLVDFLSKFGDWDDTSIPRGTRPLDYLQQLSRAERALVIHGNYLDREELQFLADRRGSMSLVYCPRTHAFFGHKPYPLAEALSLGVRVAVGTDSRASNPDLNLLEELRFIVRQHPQVLLNIVLEMGTLAGAQALGRADVIGTLARGKYANLTAIELPDTGGDPYELLLAGSGQALGTWFRGQLIERIMTNFQ